jgi:hypothetical protein
MFLSTSGSTAADGTPDPTQMAGPDSVQVTLSAVQTTTSWDAGDPGQRPFELPLLYLHREREATAAHQRTLIINVAGVAAGIRLRLEAVSLHENIATGQPHRETKNVVAPDRPCTAESPCAFAWTFDGTALSDLYTLRVKDRAGRTLWKQPNRPSFAMLDMWEVPVSAASEAYTVRVTYATLFPFAKGQNDHENRLTPGQVTDFIESSSCPSSGTHGTPRRKNGALARRSIPIGTPTASLKWS